MLSARPTPMTHPNSSRKSKACALERAREKERGVKGGGSERLLPFLRWQIWLDRYLFIEDDFFFSYKTVFTRNMGMCQIFWWLVREREFERSKHNCGPFHFLFSCFFMFLFSEGAHARTTIDTYSLIVKLMGEKWDRQPNYMSWPWEMKIGSFRHGRKEI